MPRYGACLRVKATLKARNAAKDAGAEVIVVITHMGVTGFSNGVPFGPLIDFANAVNDHNTKIDVILGDNTDVMWSGRIKGALVHENASKGVSYGRSGVTDAESGVTNVTDEPVTVWVRGSTEIAVLQRRVDPPAAPVIVRAARPDARPDRSGSLRHRRR
jgi:hypothetical protein